jgi:hypothetical protein
MKQLALALALAVGCSPKPHSTTEHHLTTPAVITTAATADVPAKYAAPADPTLDPTYIAPTDNGKQWRVDSFPSPPEPDQRRDVERIARHNAEALKSAHGGTGGGTSRMYPEPMQ